MTRLSSSFATGGGGFFFESRVQASFVALMLTGGCAPCLPGWPIVEIKLQGKVDGYETDDVIVFAEKGGKKRKLLGQIKSSISITEGDSEFGKTMQAAWLDFNDPKHFTKGEDIIALLTGPLSAADRDNALWLLEQAKRTKDAAEFFRHAKMANFSPSKSGEKLDAIQYHLKAANGGEEISEKELYNFLEHFHILNYDLGGGCGVIDSLMHSLIAQFQPQNPQDAWSRIIDITGTWNQNAGTVTREKLPKDIREKFEKRAAVMTIPAKFDTSEWEKAATDWARHPDATYLAFAVLVGGWDEGKDGDKDIIARWLGIDYGTWQGKAREILPLPGSPLSVKNRVWKVANRADLWRSLGARFFDADLDKFRALAVEVLTAPNPAFELPANQRFMASVYGKDLRHSDELRQGMAEGLAILGNLSVAKHSYSLGKAEDASLLAARDIFAGADWKVWGSINRVLPALAEAAPKEFIRAVEEALNREPCPFAQLFAEEGDGVTGGNHLTGLLWALETLAWDEEHLVTACDLLGELASRDPGGPWSNRPISSLKTILLPWLPQTKAPVEKRNVAVRTVIKGRPDIGWGLLMGLLPGHSQISFGARKPEWRNLIPSDWKARVTNEEYRQQAEFHAGLVIETVANDAARLAKLTEHLGRLPQTAFDRFIDALASSSISEQPEEQRLALWENLVQFIRRHRRYSEAEWALPEDAIVRIENIAERLAPTQPANQHRYLFAHGTHLSYEGDDCEEQRDAAAAEIYRQNGMDGIIRFADSVETPGNAGWALGAVEDAAIEGALLPGLLDMESGNGKELAGGFIRRRRHINDWEWCDGIDKSGWTSAQIGAFLACLPFCKEAWDRAARWLGEDQGEYWTRANANVYDGIDIYSAIDKLIEHGRPHAAINLIVFRIRMKLPINAEQCVRALLAAISSSEPAHARDGHDIEELIMFLQSEPSVNEEDMFKIEWAYLPLLEGQISPKILEGKLAGDPKFFCEIIRLIFRSKKEGKSPKEFSEEKRAAATNAYRLLQDWKTPPGLEGDGTFNAAHFDEWLRRTKEICAESGHLESALGGFGGVLIYAPPDPGGLWIHKSVASVLNELDAEEMRSGFRMRTFNSRGASWVDPTGKPEKELAAKFRRKGDELENAGFHRFAGTLRELADGYDRDAERNIDEHKNDGE